MFRGVLQLCFEVLDAIHEQLDHRLHTSKYVVFWGSALLARWHDYNTSGMNSTQDHNNAPKKGHTFAVRGGVL